MNLDMQIVITGAFRYALGRMTYVVSGTCNVIEAVVEELDINSIRLMIREIDAAIVIDRAGMPMDVQRWQACRAILSAEEQRRS